MALKAVRVSDVPSLDELPAGSSALHSTRFSRSALDVGRNPLESPSKFLVIGHRGSGMNLLQSSDPRMSFIKENSILSFNNASKFGLDFVEFDVQVTKDECPVIFHDNFIISEEKGTIFEKRVTEMCVSEFLSYGPQKELGKFGKPLLRKTKDGKILSWNVKIDDPLCTLQEAFQKVNPSVGFNIEVKFDDDIVYNEEHLTHVLQAIVQVIYEYAQDRPIMFSTFQPDAALLIKKLQATYPVFFLTNGGCEIYHDVRRNSLEEAIKLCLEGCLQGIVSEVKRVFRNPGAVTKIKESKLSLLTYGKLNNVAEAVYLQQLMGVEGVIVDLVGDVMEAVKAMPAAGKGEREGQVLLEAEEATSQAETKPQFSQRELSFLLKLIPALMQL